MRLSIYASRAIRSFWGLNDIIINIIMDSQPLDSSYSLDEYHSFSFYKSFEEKPNLNDKSVSHIESSELEKPEKSSI